MHPAVVWRWLDCEKVYGYESLRCGYPSLPAGLQATLLNIGGIDTSVICSRRCMHHEGCLRVYPNCAWVYAGTGCCQA